MILQHSETKVKKLIYQYFNQEYQKTAF